MAKLNIGGPLTCKTSEQLERRDGKSVRTYEEVFKNYYLNTAYSIVKMQHQKPLCTRGIECTFAKYQMMKFKYGEPNSKNLYIRWFFVKFNFVWYFLFFHTKEEMVLKSGFCVGIFL